MTTRRFTSHKVVLTAAFLALAAGGTAACDAASDDDVDSDYEYSSDTGAHAGPAADPTPSPSPSTKPTLRATGKPKSSPTPARTVEVGSAVTVDEDTDGEQSDDLVFYCADENAEIVDEQYCADDSYAGTYFLWHSSSYPRDLWPGTILDGGDYIATDDRQARTALKLPATGRVANGTIKTNVVGRGSGSSGFTGGDSAGG